MRKIIILSLLCMIAIAGYSQYREVRLPKKPKATGYINYDIQETGFWYALESEVGSSVMEHSTNMQFVAATFTGGYRINEFLRLGAGFGARVYVNNSNIRNKDSKFGLPIYANARGNIISAVDRDGVPYWSFNIGGITNDGFYLSPTIGYSFGGIRNKFLLGLSYSLTNFKTSEEIKRTYSYLSIKLGYEF